MKWESLLERSLSIGATYIATGHYARVVTLENGRYALKKSATQAKDQTYALYNLTQEQLSRTLMPVGEYTKDEIRAIAAEIGLCIAQKPDSQEICFVTDNDYAGFIEDYTGTKLPQGNFVDTKGNVLGKHKGIIHYTVGQRKGLGIALGKPAFVVEIRPTTNEVVIGSNDEVFANSLIANNLNAMSIPEYVDGMEVTAKIRYNHEGSKCRITKISDDEIRCDFDEPQRAITPGQAVVFYDGDIVVGGGSIIKAVI